MYIFLDECPSSPTSGRVGGEVKLSISYRNGTLFIMVMHIKDLVSIISNLVAKSQAFNVCVTIYEKLV